MATSDGPGAHALPPPPLDPPPIWVADPLTDSGSWQPGELPSSFRRRRTRFVEAVTSRYAYQGRRFRQTFSPRRRWTQLTTVIGVIRAAAPEGGYLAAVGRYVYTGRRYSGFFAKPRRRLLAGIGAAVLVLGTVVTISVATRRDAPPPAGNPGTAPAAFPPALPLTPPTLPPATSAAPTTPPPSSAPPSTSAAPAPPRSPAPVELRAEAEAARLIGDASITTLRTASGGKVVANLGTRGGRSRSTGGLQFERLNAPRAGRYALTIYYLSPGGERTALIVVNGRQMQTLRFPATDGDDVRSATFTIDLVAGNNTITYGNATGPAASLDRITLYG